MYSNSSCSHFVYRLQFVQTPERLTVYDVDLILDYGHQFYEQIIASSSDQRVRYLGHWELPHTVDLGSEVVNVAYYTDMFFGVNSQSLGQIPTNDGRVTISEAFNAALQYLITFF